MNFDLPKNLPLFLTGALLFAACASTPVQPAADATSDANSGPWGDFSTAALCGTSATSLNLSPPPLIVRLSGDSVALPGHVLAVGAPLPGAWSDFLEDTQLAEDPTAVSPFAIRFLDAAALAEAQTRCQTTLPASDEAYALVVGDAEVAIAGSPRGQARALATLTELVQQSPPGKLTRVSLFDAPLVQTRTVLEGFYGVPWDLAGRLAAIRRAAALRFNTYIHAPKADYFSTYVWYAPYAADDFSDIVTLAAYTQARGIDFCWELAPGNNITYSDPSQLDEMTAKFDLLHGAGLRCFVLAFDDTPKQLTPDDLATGQPFVALQTGFIRAVADHLATLPGPVSLAVVPNDYSTQMMHADPQYIAALAKLPAAIELGWTGTDVVSQTVTAADVAIATQLLGRPPVLVDNYPVTDVGTNSGPLNLLPITGRDPGIFSGLSGYGGNALLLPRASFVALASLAELAWNPAAYDPERALQRGVAVAARGPNPALALLAADAQGLAVGPDQSAPELRAAMAAYQADPANARAGLVTALTQLRDVDLGLATADSALVAELAPWTQKARGWAQLGLDLVAARDQDAPHAAPSAALADFQQRLDALQNNPAVLADAAFVAFAKASLTLLGP